MIDVEFDGWDEATNFYKRYTASATERWGTYLERLADSIIAEARNNIQNNRSINTGLLLTSIRIIENIKGKEIFIGTDLPYAKYIEYGRGPVHAKGKPLVWKDKTSGKIIFSMSSKATEPKPFLEPAAISELKKFPQVWAELENEYISELR